MKLRADSTFGTILMVLLFLGLAILLNSCGQPEEAMGYVFEETINGYDDVRETGREAMETVSESLERQAREDQKNMEAVSVILQMLENGEITESEARRLISAL